MIVVSGVPRSGTSVCTNIILELLGEDRLIGSKFMGRDKPDHKPKSTKKELRPIQEYNKTKWGKERKTKPDKREFKEMKDMNPNGFFECPFTVHGLYWRKQVHDLMKRVDDLDNEPFCKIVSNGLLKSDPTKISKIVYMLRDPREVAKSQERLKRKEKLPEGEVIHSPDFFITATTQFCKWAVKYAQDVEVLIVNHGELLKDPETNTAKIAEFIGVPAGDAYKVVEADLHRSKPQDIPHPQWVDADEIYELMGKSDFQGVLDYMANPELETHKQHANFYCHRFGASVTKNQCELCKSTPKVTAQFKKTAEKRKVDWASEPCAYECGALNGDDYITIEESVSKNHWHEA